MHGATFPSALSVRYRFVTETDDRSWADALCAAGFDVWALDFLGFGDSERWPAMAGPAAAQPPL
ncbi:MAG TPA: alpha/beta hydrolase, partial [Thalassobaculum sp.]